MPKTKAPDVRKTMEKLQLLNLRECATVGQLVDAMSRCSFGARMLGNVAATLTKWVQEEPRPIIVYDGRLESLLGRELALFVRRKWFCSMYTSREYARRHPSGRVFVVGEYMERHATALATFPNETIFVNGSGQVPPGRVRDGHFPGVIFADPMFVIPALRAVLEERLQYGTPWTVSDFMQVLAYTDGLGREVWSGASVLRQAVHDPDTTLCLTLSGAMTIAKMGLVVCDMIDLGMVDHIASTGALMAHGLVEGIGLTHYAYDPKHPDTLLADQSINRVTDTLEPEENFDHIEEVVTAVLAEFNGRRPLSPTEFHRAIGKHLSTHFPESRGILKSAFERNVPVAVPAFVDSEIGNDVFVENMRRKRDGQRRLIMDLERDTEILLNIATKAKRLGIFSIGGGVPRNNTQNVAPLIEIANARLGLSMPAGTFHYAVRIDPTPMHFGNLSGCTYSEGVSWRKFDPKGMRAEVHADATIVWPFIVKYVMEHLGDRSWRRNPRPWGWWKK